MKNLLVIAIVSMFFASCSSIGNMHLFRPKIKESMAVKTDSVPPVVISAFQDKYAGILVDKWYKLNKKNYAARFMQSGSATLAFFSTSGYFSDEELSDQDNYDPYDDFDQWELDAMDEY